MMAEWEIPPFLEFLHLQSVAVWGGKLQGTRPKESPTHYDPADNLFLQLKGSKIFGMFGANHAVAIHPKFMRHVYSANPDDRNSKEETGNSIQDNFSPINPHKPDLKTFPRAKHATPIICKMQEGDALFMPAFTWHSVKSFGAVDSDPVINKVNLGINIWFAGNVQHQLLFESLMTILQGGSVGELHETKDDDILAESESGRPFEDL